MTAVFSVNLEKDKKIHDDIIKWKHFSHYWPFVGGIHWSLANSPHKGQWCWALLFSLIYTWTNSWVNNWDTGDLICHRTHYDVIVMTSVDKMIIFCIPEFLWLRIVLLQHQTWVMYIYVHKLGHHSGNDCLPGQHQDIIWSNDGLLLIGLLETMHREILIKMQQF